MHIPHTIQVWGIASFICFGFATTFLEISENRLHTFCFINHRVRGWYGNLTFPFMKKVFLVVAAFMIGAFMSVAIQACADDDQTETQGPNSSNNGNNGGNENESSSDDDNAENQMPHCNCSWAAQRMASITNYDENGIIFSKITYSYDSHGRVAKSETLSYSYNNSGQRFLNSVDIITYTYSGKIQIGIHKYTSYNENGGIQSSYTMKTEYCLYEE